ncbi:siderophore-interacting protein [Streptomyces spiroverticillatus]|uniref:Siderophore-interacting protein n=1 Tax=Streptomyces finlayi TaxID=67296 RepID=A0A918X0R0_9ACTN|nr:siderophore-interacting protein [Streptomyces finlayi]GHA38678.1 siderophore-interacting protein [Streptomyces spiroverticillatus]GHD00797.1 siderophore-interacting protein [Streptomyces finlayi]
MAKDGKYRKPEQREFLVLRVVARKQISPNFVRVTLGGDALRNFVPMGYDQWFRVFLPTAKGVLRLPKRTNGLWVAEYMLMSKDTRPIGRNYTVRHHRTEGLYGEGPELDVDFVLHEDADGKLGPASAWARDAAPGDEIGIFDEGITYLPPAHTTWRLLVGDESALPALLGILASATDDTPTEVYVELPDPDDAQPLPAPRPNTTVHWLTRPPGTPVGDTALAALRAATLPEGPGYAWTAGGRRLATGVRRHLVTDRGFPKDTVTFTGYWR